MLGVLGSVFASFPTGGPKRRVDVREGTAEATKEGVERGGEALEASAQAGAQRVEHVRAHGGLEAVPLDGLVPVG